jgi:hypothetical protein
MTGHGCTGAEHRPPSAGGSCPCGMVTRIPARRPEPARAVRDLLVRSLGDVPDASAAADRLLAALAAAGLAVAPGERRPA